MISLDVPEISSSNNQLTTLARILVVEDEPLIRDMIVLSLEDEGYEIITACDGREALELLESEEDTSYPSSGTDSGGDHFSAEFPIDLVILDLMLPQVNGLDICRLLRYKGNIVPILILSAKASETDRVIGLEVGADDYLTKPFSMRELIARCRALLRRQRFMHMPPQSIKQYRDISLFPQECRVLVRGESVNLSPKEFRLLDLFMDYPRRVWSREQIIEQVWGMDFLGDTKTVDVHIRWLREKLELDPSHPQYLITVRGFGYRFG